MSNSRKKLIRLLLGSVLLVGAIMVALVGCTHATTWQQLKGKVSPLDVNSLPDIAFYCGSEDGFDYFFVQPGLRWTENSGTTYRVSSAESPVKRRFPFTKERSQWVAFDLRAEMPAEELRAAVIKQLEQQPTPATKNQIMFPSPSK